MLWSEGGRFREAEFGPLYLAIEEHDFSRYGEESYFEWYIMPDNEDKSHERAYWSSEFYRGPSAIEAMRPTRRLKTFEEARLEVLEAAGAFIERLSDALVKLREDH